MSEKPRKIYEIVFQEDRTYGVRVSEGGSVAVIGEFATQAQARGWIIGQRRLDLQELYRAQAKVVAK
jgi:hypothetical protein